MELKLVIIAIFIYVLFLSSAQADPFNSTWNTALTSTGSSNSNQIKLPLTSTGNYNFQVWWGDGSNDTITIYNQANVTHTYASSDTYDIAISGTIEGFRFDNGGDKLKIINITDWGDLNLGNSGSYFYGCRNLNVSATNILNLTGTTTFEEAFRDCYALTSLNTSGWDTGSVTTFSRAFQNCYALTTLDVSGWNTSSVTSFFVTFYGCSGLTALDVSNWDTSSVTEFDYIFYYCSGLTTLDVSGWDTSSVTSFYEAFSRCHALTSLNVSGWDTSSVIKFSRAFDGCYALTSLNTSGWNTSSVTTFELAFHDCHALTTLDVSGWDTSSVTSFSRAFRDCYTLTTLNVSGWDTSSVTTFYYAVLGCSGLTTLDTSAWDTSSVTSFQGAFYGCSGLTALDVSNWDTSSVTRFQHVFWGCSALTSLNVSGWDTSSVTSFDYAFSGCSALTTVTGIGSLDVSAVTSMTDMFQGITLTTSNYDSLLTGWALLSTLQNAVPFHGGSSQYSLNAEYSINKTMIGDYSWTITDDGLETGNSVTSLHYNESIPYFHRVEIDSSLFTNRSVISGDFTGWTANSTDAYNTYWIFTTAVTPAGSTNFTISGSILDNFTARDLVASMQYNLSNSSGTVEQQTTDGSGTATFEVNLINGEYVIQISTIPPASIIGLTNITSNFWHNWSWINPVDIDFNYTQIYINDIWTVNTSNDYYNLSTSAHNSSTISIKTVDTAGNINATWVNHTSVIPNNAITITNTSDYNGTEGTQALIDFNYTDIDGDIPFFQTNATVGSLNSSTGVFTWTPSPGDAEIYHFNFTVSDNEGSVDYYVSIFTITEDSTVVLTNPNPLTGVEVNEGIAQTFSITSSVLSNSTWTFDGNEVEVDNLSINPSYTIATDLDIGQHILHICTINANNFSNSAEYTWHFTIIEYTVPGLSSGGSGGRIPSITVNISNEPSDNVLYSESGFLRNIKINDRISYVVRNDEDFAVTTVSFIPSANSREQPVYLETLRRRSIFTTENVPNYEVFSFNLFVGTAGYDSKTEQEKIFFKLKKSGVKEAGVDAVSIKLYKWSDEKDAWIQKYTDMTGSDEYFYYYEADSGATTGRFAIAGEERYSSFFDGIGFDLPGLGNMKFIIPDFLRTSILELFIKSIEDFINELFREYGSESVSQEGNEAIGFATTTEQESGMESKNTNLNIIIISVLSMALIGTLAFYFNSKNWNISMMIGIALLIVIYLLFGDSMISVFDSGIINLIVNVTLITIVSYLAPVAIEEVKGEM